VTDSTLQDIAQQALSETGSASAAIFLVGPAGDLALAAAAGVTGAPLDALVAAVQSPDHPIAVTARDGHTAYDVTPIAPGGPALRSHIAMKSGSVQGHVVGVLALAHQEPLTVGQQLVAEDLAAQAAALA